MSSSNLHSGLGRFVTDMAERNTAILSLSFFFVFSAFNVAQNFATSVNKRVGALSLAILYAVFTVSNLFIPQLIGYLSPRNTMFMGATTYLIFVASNIHLVDAVLYAASALMGVGAAAIWVGEGAYITSLCHTWERRFGQPLNSNLGYFNGIFFMSFQCTQCFGNLIAALLFQFGVSKTVVYIILTVFAAFGSLCFLLIRPFPDDYVASGPAAVSAKANVTVDISATHLKEPRITPETSLLTPPPSTGASLRSTANGNSVAAASSPLQQTDDGIAVHTTTDLSPPDQNVDELSIALIPESTVDSSKQTPEVANVIDVFRQWQVPNFYVLFFMTLYTGLFQEFVYGEFPARIGQNSHKFFSLAIFGLLDASCSLWFGGLSDSVGRFPVFAVGMAAHSFAYIFWFIRRPSHVLYEFIIVAVFLGVGDAAFNTQISALYPIMLSAAPESFANLKFIQSLAIAYGFVSHNQTSFRSKLILNQSVLAVSMLALFTNTKAKAGCRPKAARLMDADTDLDVDPTEIVSSDFEENLSPDSDLTDDALLPTASHRSDKALHYGSTDECGSDGDHLTQLHCSDDSEDNTVVSEMYQ